MKTRLFDINDIEILPNRRPVNEETVRVLASSIQSVGLRYPITVRIVPSMMLDGELVRQVPVLVTGQHRLEALKSLKRMEIEAQVVEVDDIEAELVEIAENLHRAELTALERDEQVARWIELIEEKQAAEKLSQSETVSKKGGRGNEGGVRAAARDLGIKKDDAHRATKVAKLTPEAKEAAKGLGLADHRTALLDAAKKDTAEEQIEVLRQRKKRAAAPAVKSPAPASEKPLEDDLLQSPLERIKAAYEQLSAADKRAFATRGDKTIAALKAENKKLKQELEVQRGLRAHIRAERDTAKQQNLMLEAEVKHLQEQLAAVQYAIASGAIA